MMPKIAPGSSLSMLYCANRDLFADRSFDDRRDSWRTLLLWVDAFISISPVKFFGHD